MPASKKKARAKPGRKPPRPHTGKQVGEAFFALRQELNDAAIIAGTGVLPRISEAAAAAVSAYLNELDPLAWERDSLAYVAARLARGHGFDAVAQAPHGLELKSSRALVAVIARKYPTPLGKAFAIYRILARGITEVPQRRSPSGELKRQLEWRLAQFPAREA